MTHQEALKRIGNQIQYGDRECKVVGVDTQEPKTKRSGVYLVLKPLEGDQKWLRMNVSK